MPGVASYLHRHEWYKHGVCYGTSADQYFRDAIALLQMINDSPVRDLFVDNIGKRVESQAIREKFSEAFGLNAGAKVNVRCARGSGLITELWINLGGDIGPDASLAELLKNAKPAKLSCQGGTIDPVGYE